MSLPEIDQAGSSTAEMLRLTLGPESEYFIEQMRSRPPEQFAVIKVGGATVRDDLHQLTGDLAALSSLGLTPVIVHGGNPQINADLAEHGIPETKIDGKRVTDEATLGSVERGLGQVNATIVEALQTRGVPVTGITGGVFKAKQVDGPLGLVGDVTSMDTDAILEAIEQGSIPVVSCFGQSEDGQKLNINGDSAASALASQLQTDRYIALSDVPGVLDDNHTVIPVLNGSDTAEELIIDGTIDGGMIPKVRDAFDLLAKLPDSSTIVITSPDHLLRELFTNQGAGTILRRGDAILPASTTDAVDKKRITDIIERSFGKQLDRNYFDNLPESAKIFVAGEDYKGVAVVIPDDGANGHVEPAYVDKLAVNPEDQGYGVGDELIRKVCQEHPEGVYWRVSKDNESLQWYRSRGLGQEYDPGGKFLVFFTEQVPPELRVRLAAAAVALRETVIPVAHDTVSTSN